MFWFRLSPTLLLFFYCLPAIIGWEHVFSRWCSFIPLVSSSLVLCYDILSGWICLVFAASDGFGFVDGLEGICVVFVFYLTGHYSFLYICVNGVNFFFFVSLFLFFFFSFFCNSSFQGGRKRDATIFERDGGLR